MSEIVVNISSAGCAATGVTLIQGPEGPTGPAGGPIDSLAKSANLSDLTNAGTARNNLGLGSAAVQPASAFDASGAAAAAQAAAQAACPAETATTIGALISGATGKTTPADADALGLSDSAASNVLKELTWANAKAALKTYFDTMYQVAGSYITSGGALGTPSSGNLANCTGAVDTRIATSGNTVGNVPQFTSAGGQLGASPISINGSNVGIGTPSPGAKLEVAGQIAAFGGSAGAPGLSFAGDLDTGLYEIAANRIGVTAGGNVLWDLDGASKTSTLIGSTTTASYGQAPFTISDIAETFRLAMYANATTEKAGIQVWKSGVGTNYPLLLQEAGGNVGIGAPTPICKADIDGPVRCKSYTRATVPSAAAGDGQMIYVTNPSDSISKPYWSAGGGWYSAAGAILA